MDDVRTVLDAVGSERTVLFGSGDGAAMLALFAATYPERTTALVVFQAQPRVTWAPDYPWGMRPEEARRWIEEAEQRFGDPAYFKEGAAVWFPSIAEDEEAVERMHRIWLLSSSPGSHAAFRRMNMDIDVRHVLPTIRVPTLVLQRASGTYVPSEVGRYVANQIPGARYEEIAGADIVPWLGDPTAVTEAVEGFLANLTDRTDGDDTVDRILATVLFTDIVDSTAKAVELGDARWRELLREHHARVRAELTRFDGREVNTAGDGFLATFDGPARAIRCGCAVRDVLKDLGIEIRVGLHTGECELIEGEVGGVAVHIGARVAASAHPGEVLVSSTVKDLVAGSGINFADRGLHELKGIPGEWRLYAVTS
jgi:class 3 adenylate cyclase